MSYSNIDPAIWDDPEFYMLRRDAQLLWFYLLTGPEANSSVPGIVRLAIAGLADAMRMAPQDCDRALVQLVDRGWIRVERQYRLIQIPAAPSYRPPGNTNVLKGWFRRWKMLPKCEMKYEHIEALWAAVEPKSEKFHETWNDTFGEVVVPQSLSKGFAKGSDTGYPHNPQGSLFGNDSGEGKAFESLSKATRSVVSNPDSAISSPESEIQAPRVPRGTKKSAHLAEAERLWELQNQLRSEGNPNLRPLQGTPDRLKRICWLLENGRTVADCEAVLRAYAAEATANPESWRHMNGETNWRPANFDRTLGAIGAPRASRAPAGGRKGPAPASVGSETAEELRERLAREGVEPLMPPGVGQ